MAVITYLYDAAGNDRTVELTDEALESLGTEQLLWIDIDDRNIEDLGAVGLCLGLDQASLQNLAGKRASQLEIYGSYAHFNVATAPEVVLDDEQPDSRRKHGGVRLDFVVGQAWLLTVHDGKIDFIEAFRKQDSAETIIGKLTTHDFAASLLDAHLEAFFEEVARIETLVDRLDEQALTKPSSKSLLGRMVTLRRRVSHLRVRLSAQRSVFYGLSRPDLQLVTESGASPHFQVLMSRFERAIDEVEHTRDLVVGSFELFSTRTAQQTNELVKVLTFLTAVVGICAAVAGLFGMNFETDFFKAGDAGFYGTIAGLLLAVVVAALVARWRNWL